MIEHAKKCGAYEFYGNLNPSQVDRSIKITEKAFNTLQLSEEKRISNVYRLLFDKVDDWLTRIINLYGEVLSWQIFKEEFHREYLSKSYKKEKNSILYIFSLGINDSGVT